MPRDNLESEPVLDSLFKLARGGRSWMAAEAALAKAELSADGKRLALIVVLAALAISNIIAAVMLASGGTVLLLAPHVGGLANATGILTFVLVILAAICSWWIFHLTQSPLGITSVLKRWGLMATKANESDQ
jgi:hypothetical protein